MKFEFDGLDLDRLPTGFKYSVCLEHEVDLDSTANPSINRLQLIKILEKYQLQDYADLLMHDYNISAYKNEYNYEPEHINLRLKRNIENDISLINATLLILKSKERKSGVEIRLKDIREYSVILNNDELTSASPIYIIRKFLQIL